MNHLPLYQVDALLKRFEAGCSIREAAAAVGIAHNTAERYHRMWRHAKATGLRPLDEAIQRREAPAGRGIYLGEELRSALEQEAERRGLDVAGLVRLCLRRLAEGDLFDQVLDKTPQIQRDGRSEAAPTAFPQADGDDDFSDLPAGQENRHEVGPEPFSDPPEDLIVAERDRQEEQEVDVCPVERQPAVSAPPAQRLPAVTAPKPRAQRKPPVKVHFEMPDRGEFNPAYDPARDGYRPYRDLTAELMGDPPIGRSALDQKRMAEA